MASDGLEMDRRELEVLRMACSEADMLGLLEASFEGQPTTVKGAQGQMVAHPLIGEIRRSRTTIQSLLKQISLQDPSLQEGSRRGKRTTSTSARMAALSRHYG